MDAVLISDLRREFGFVEEHFAMLLRTAREVEQSGLSHTERARLGGVQDALESARTEIQWMRERLMPTADDAQKPAPMHASGIRYHVTVSTKDDGIQFDGVFPSAYDAVIEARKRFGADPSKVCVRAAWNGRPCHGISRSSAICARCAAW